MASLADNTGAPQEARADGTTALLIDAAPGIAQAQGAPVAAHWLHTRGVGFAVTARVLMEPQRRRPSHPAAAPAAAGPTASKRHAQPAASPAWITPP